MKTIPLDHRNPGNGNRFPFVLLLCDSNPFSIVRCFERALYDAANLVVVNLDIHEWFIKRFGLPDFYKFLKPRLKHLSRLPLDPDLFLVVEPYLTSSHR